MPFTKLDLPVLLTVLGAVSAVGPQLVFAAIVALYVVEHCGRRPSPPA